MRRDAIIPVIRKDLEQCGPVAFAGDIITGCFITVRGRSCHASVIMLERVSIKSCIDATKSYDAAIISRRPH